MDSEKLVAYNVLHLFVSGKGTDEFSSSSKHQHPISCQIVYVFWKAVTLMTIAYHYITDNKSKNR